MGGAETGEKVSIFCLYVADFRRGKGEKKKKRLNKISKL